MLTLEPAAGGVLAVNRSTYRGSLRLLPAAGGRFDVVNVVDVDGYLKGVLAKEMFPDWQPEAYKAQAIVARTYALYVAHTDGLSAPRGTSTPTSAARCTAGYAAETAKSRDAVDSTAGVVLDLRRGRRADCSRRTSAVAAGA